jgi:CDP-6-deoxy-D-xylo-4-hexulose-3-dehydrase
MSQKDLLKQQILDLTREYYKEVHGSSRSFEPGKFCQLRRPLF